MTSPRVVELPRRLEPAGRDTFLAGCEPQPRLRAVARQDADGSLHRPSSPPRPVSYVGNVVPLRPRDALGSRRPPTLPAAPAAA
ncbi:MAG TPA: hypothetical protein VGV67_10405 [Solirubrobacteraceae bacterium]|nr:hypothetical protein [Solirubrobacteraceae bacterium]